MSKDLSSVKMSEEETLDLLKSFLQEITGSDQEITMDTLLIDDLGLDSLGFLDLFFTIQTSIQKEVTNEQMRNLIAEELGADRTPGFATMSEGEKDRMMYPRLKVGNFFNIIRRQLDGGIGGVSVEEQSEKLLASGVVDTFMQSGFEGLKAAKLEEYLIKKKVKDPNLEKAVREAFAQVTPEKVKELIHDKRIVQNIVRDFLKKTIGHQASEELKKRLRPGVLPSMTEPGVSRDDMMMSIYSSILAELDGGQAAENLDADEFAERLTQALQGDPEKLANLVMQNSAMQELIIKEIIDTRIDEIFEKEIQTQASQVNDKDLSDFVRANFFTAEFKASSMEKYLDPTNAHADLIRKVMAENFDTIVAKETDRIVSDTDLRNRLIQEYIRDHYDPMQAMELNSPEKMKELQRKITQKYIDANMDEIMSRYMEEYMQLYMETMLDEMPEEDDIEVSGDSQDQFMKNFVDKMQVQQESVMESGNDLVRDFINTYAIEDPLLLSFMETNFDEMSSYFRYFENMDYSHDLIQDWVLKEFDILQSMYLLLHLEDVRTDVSLRKEFLQDFMKNHFDDLMELSIRRQFEDSAQQDEIFTPEEKEKYTSLLDQLVKKRLQSMIDKARPEDMETQIMHLAKEGRVIAIAPYLDVAQFDERHLIWALDLLKRHLTEFQALIKPSSVADNLPLLPWLIQMHQRYPGIFTSLEPDAYNLLIQLLAPHIEHLEDRSGARPEILEWLKKHQELDFSEALQKISDTGQKVAVMNALFADPRLFFVLKEQFVDEMLVAKADRKGKALQKKCSDWFIKAFSSLAVMPEGSQS